MGATGLAAAGGGRGQRARRSKGNEWADCTQWFRPGSAAMNGIHSAGCVIGRASKTTVSGTTPARRERGKATAGVSGSEGLTQLVGSHCFYRVSDFQESRVSVRRTSVL